MISTKKPPRRTYNSSRRKDQARQTRRQIVEAAGKLFNERGYAGTTMEAIALEAGVAVETIYASFGNKRAILSNLIGFSLVGDDDPTPLLQRQGPHAVQQEKDQHRQIRLFADDMVEIMGRVSPLFTLMRAAAKTEPDIAELLQTILDERVQGMKVFIKSLIANGPLQDNLTQDEAAETVWAVTSGEVYTLFVMDRGWSAEKYKKWLTNTLTKLLLP
jgi:TetR/AcrR family transcriptional regulator of autoinduction and epiphytic fitness